MILLEMLHELQDICKCRGSSRPAPNYLNGDLARGSTDNGFMLHSATSFNTVSSQDFLSWLLLHTVDSVDQTLLLYSQGGIHRVNLKMQDLFVLLYTYLVAFVISDFF